MPKNLSFLNLRNVFNSFRKKEIPSPRRLLIKFSSFKKKGAKLACLVKDKFDRSFAASTKVPEDEGTEVKGRRLELPVDRPRRCLCNKSEVQPKWRSKISEIGSMARNSLTRSREPSAATSQPDTQDAPDPSGATSPPDRTESLAAIAEEELNLIIDPELQSVRSSRLSKDNGTLPETEQLEDKGKPPTPERLPSLEEQRRSSVTPQRTSLPLAIEPMAAIEEIDKEMTSLKIEEIEESVAGSEIPVEEAEELLVEATVDRVEEVRANADIKEVVDKEEEPIHFEIVNISRRDFDEMERDSNIRRIIRIDHKTLPPDIEGSSALRAGDADPRDGWTDVPAPVIDEIRRLTKPKRPHKCPKACPCKFTDELIKMYHEARLLSSRADKIGEAREHCTFRMTSSEVDFFKKDTKMCSVMIGETRSRRAEMRELMDMWQEANEKLAGRKKEIFSIVESIERTGKRIGEMEDLLKDWLPEGRMEKLRKAQRAIEKEDEEIVEASEDEERTFGKERIEGILQKRESWHEEEKIREEKCKNQRQRDTETLQNATNLMQKYIEERKSLLIR